MVPPIGVVTSMLPYSVKPWNIASKLSGLCNRMSRFLWSMCVRVCVKIVNWQNILDFTIIWKFPKNQKKKFWKFLILFDHNVLTTDWNLTKFSQDILSRYIVIKISLQVNLYLLSTFCDYLKFSFFGKFSIFDVE